MASDGVQITIPDFDDNDFQSTPIPFGRSGAQGFGAFGGYGSGSESPTAITPIGLPDRSDRSYFHSRGDSVTSDDSTHSHSMRATKVFAHSAHSSVTAVTSSPFSKKPSFASIRNAFKSSMKNSDALPPLPQIDHHAYPILKNPFNRSTSSLTQPAVSSAKPSASSPPHARAPTPGSGDSKTRTTSRARGHSNARSHTSQSGSIFHSSDTASDIAFGFPYSSSPPPVPRMPDNFGFQTPRSETPVNTDESHADNVEIDPRTPADYALHAVFMRFATMAEDKIESFLMKPMEFEPLLSDSMGPGVDPKFDDLLQSLGRIGQKHAKAVIEIITRWRRSQDDTMSPHITKHHASVSPTHNRSAKSQDIQSVLSERKSLASIYVMCRVLIAVLQMVSKDSLGESLGYTLEETTFEQFKRPDLKLLAQSANHRANAELYATMLGLLANVRFISVTDRFLNELGPVAAAQVAKDQDTKYETLVKGLRHVKLKVWPPEAFEEGAEFMESLAKSFENAHGLRFKTAFAETLTRLLHGIGKTAQAEVNHPQWAKAIEKIYPRAREMMNKPRYWTSAYPLAITSLCVAPHQYFLRNWTACFEAGFSKLKDKPYRTFVMNGMLRLIWTYLYRCQDSASAATSKMDSLLKHFLPPSRLTIYPSEEHLEPFIYIVHFVLSRHFDYGQTLCLDLLQESNIGSNTNIPHVLSPERMSISVQAVLLSLHGIEKEEPTPPWPSSVDFSVVPSREDYASSSDVLPAAVLSKPGVQELFDRFGVLMTIIARFCNHAIGRMSIFDEQWSISPVNATFDETHLVIRRQVEGSFGYPNQLVSPMTMLRICFQSWPRCLHPSLPLQEAVEMLIRGVIHVEPSIGEVAAAALRRFVRDPQHACLIISQTTSFLFDPPTILHEGSGIKFVLESPKLLNLLVSVVEGWVDLILEGKAAVHETEREKVLSQCEDIAAGALFLLTFEAPAIRLSGIKLFRLLWTLPPRFSGNDSPTRLVDLLQGQGSDKSYLQGFDDLLDKSELDRLQQWRQSKRTDFLLKFAESQSEKDRKLWRYVFPAFMRACFAAHVKASATCRASIVAATTRYHPIMAHLAGLSTRIPAGLGKGAVLAGGDGYKLIREHLRNVEQWQIWVKTLCSTAVLSETRPAVAHPNREHSRAPSDASFERERMTTTRGLFRYLTPFLDSDYTPFRDTAVLSISSFPSEAYPQLLEDLNLLASRQFYDDSRAKVASAATAGRLRRQDRLHSAVARIYYLTADLLQHQRSAAKQVSLSQVLKFVRNTQIFLSSPENRDNYALQRLRRYFCGTLERLFDGLTNVMNYERFIPFNMHLALFRLCEEWCQYGPQSETVRQRLILMQRASASAANDPRAESDSAQRFQHETRLLSNAAVGALASLCQKAYFPPDISLTSPTERPTAESSKPLEPIPILEKISFILSSDLPQIQSRGRKALRSLLVHPKQDKDLLDDALRRAFISTTEPPSSNVSFFEVICDVICNIEGHHFSFGQVVCLGLANLCHDDLPIRRSAFKILDATHEQSFGILSMADIEILVGSSASSAYLRAQRLVCDCLSGEHPQQASHVLSQFATWLPRIRNRCGSRISHLLLQSLECWVQHIQLLTLDDSGISRISREGVTALYHLVSLTKRYSDEHPEQILAIWTRLVDTPYEANGLATLTFLLEQSQKVATTAFIRCAAHIVACLSHTAIGAQIFEQLCSIIEPERMLPNIDHKLALPDSDDIELWSDLDVLFAEDQPRLSLGSAQYALMFVADVTFEREWTFHEQIPLLLHALFVHLDYRVTFIRQQARRMLFQLIRCCGCRFAESSDHSAYFSRLSFKDAITNLEQEGEEIFWKDDDTTAAAAPKMQRLCAQVTEILSPVVAGLVQTWGQLALAYGTACPIRPLAFRSLQVFRALMPPVTQDTIGQLLPRLSATIASSDSNIHSFTAEIIQTLKAQAASDDLDPSLLPLLYWTTCACLSSTVEAEFAQVLELLNILLLHIDFEDPLVVESIMSLRPAGWQGKTSLQPTLLLGLRSSVTFSATFQMMQRLAKVDDSRLIDPSEGRIRDLYTMALPCCLRAMSEDSEDKSLQDFAMSIARLAEKEGRDSLARNMISFVKGRFRTKDDFLRHSISSLREHYGSSFWSEIATLLLGLVLNNTNWLRVQAMQVLKLMFQQRDARQAVDVCSELLMPLLRLLESDLASQALEVLEEPMTVSGGLAAKHIVRMSMHMAHPQEVDADADIFGIPEESGWCVARSEFTRQQCRDNILSVFGICKVSSSRPSMVEFRPEDDDRGDELEDDLGNLVQDLHELSQFFQNNKSESTTLHPSHKLEARIAAILARSTEDLSIDIPRPPLGDVFKVGGSEAMSDSDDSDNESGHDAFIYDSPTLQKVANGHQSH